MVSLISYPLCAILLCQVASVMSDSLRPFVIVAHRSLLPMGFSRQEYWSGLPCPPPGDFLTQGSHWHLLCLLYFQAGRFFAKSTNWETITKYLLTCDIVHVSLFSCNISTILLLFEKLSQTQELKTAHNFYSVSMSQEDSLAGSSAQALSRSAHKVSGKLCSHLKAHLGKDISTRPLRLLAEFIRSHGILLFQS